MVNTTRRYAMKHWLILIGMCLLMSGATASSLSPEARSQLAPSGKLRAAINYGNPVLATKNPHTGELRGVTVEVS
jgi:polar amino acid transport system substrate-binding protein